MWVASVSVELKNLLMLYGMPTEINEAYFNGENYFRRHTQIG